MNLPSILNEKPINMDFAILLLRISIATLMFTHAVPKLKNLRSLARIQFPAILGFSAKTSMALAAFTELLFSAFILIGLATRIAAIPLFITMMIAAFYALKSEPFAKKELAIAYSVFYLVLFFSGSGRFSLDYLL